MRDIIFKGKRKDNSEWVEGYLFDDGMVDSKRMFIGSLVITEHKGLGEDVWDMGHAFYEVLPDTIGQYTGLTDKNGKKVFEGDIFVYDNETTYLVKWDYEYCGFYAEAVEEYNDYDVLGNFYSSLCEAIGNIHDNPELLEVK